VEKDCSADDVVMGNVTNIFNNKYIVENNILSHVIRASIGFFGCISFFPTNVYYNLNSSAVINLLLLIKYEYVS